MQQITGPQNTGSKGSFFPQTLYNKTINEQIEKLKELYNEIPV